MPIIKKEFPGSCLLNYDLIHHERRAQKPDANNEYFEGFSHLEHPINMKTQKLLVVIFICLFPLATALHSQASDDNKEWLG